MNKVIEPINSLHGQCAWGLIEASLQSRLKDFSEEYLRLPIYCKRSENKIPLASNSALLVKALHNGEVLIAIENVPQFMQALVSSMVPEGELPAPILVEVAHSFLRDFWTSVFQQPVSLSEEEISVSCACSDEALQFYFIVMENPFSLWLTHHAQLLLKTTVTVL